jgi:hypothetical protein
MAYTVGDAVQVLVPMPRHRQAEWISAAVSMVDATRVEVTFEDQTRQRFALDTERIRQAQGRKEGERWDF